MDVSAPVPPAISRMASGSSVEGTAWRWRGPSDLAAVRTAATGAREFLQRQGLHEEELASWELVLTEAANNPVMHSPPPFQAEPWDLHLFVTAEEVVAVLTDRSAGLDWPETVDLPDPDSESGRGLFLIVTLTDSQNYARGASGNVLTLRRRRPPAAIEGLAENRGEEDSPAQRVRELESTLDSMTEELSSAYESLSAIFRFSAESRCNTDLSVFTRHLLEHLTTVTRADCGVIRLAGASGEPPVTLAVLGCPQPPGEDFMALEAAARQTRQDQWIEDLHFTGGPGILSGLVHPFYDGDAFMGTLSIGRRTVTEPLRAGDVNVVHTFSEFLAQQIMRRRHEEAALHASIMQRELELAASIQRSLLPRVMPSVSGLALSAHCESAMDVGGDFYGVLPHGNGGVFFMMADVMGKGLGAAMMAAVTRSVLRSLPQFYDNPGLVLQQAARLLYEDLDHLEMFVTAVVGTVEASSGIVRVASAGHCPVLLALPGGERQEIPACGPPLGLLAEMDYPAVEMAFPPGAQLLVFTDGLTDPRDGRGAFDSHEELAKWLRREGGPGISADGLRERLLERLHQRDAAGALADDQTFLIMRRLHPAAEL